MKIRLLPFFGISLAMLLLFVMAASVLAAPAGQVQQYSTPTPGPDGRIIYIVKAGDNCTSISLMTGVPVDYLRQTNRLDENCSLAEGQNLVIGVGGPSAVTPTAGPAPTATVGPPTPTPISGTAELCVLLYGDVNGDGLRQEEEFGVAGGAVSVTSANGTYSQTQQTVAQIDPDTEEPVRVCFGNMPPGEYTVSAAVPDAYNPTTALSYDLEVVPGNRAYVGFGAQPKAQVDVGPESSGRSPLLGILGAVILLTGVGLGVYVWRTIKKK
jgi:hypothetical protein